MEQDERIRMDLLTPLTADFMPEQSFWDSLEEDDEAWESEYDGFPLDGADLVQYQDAGVFEKDAGQRDALALTAGEVGPPSASTN